MVHALIIDDRSSHSLDALNHAHWRTVTDTVMGGKSSASLIPAVMKGRHCLHFSGIVSLENNGGFAQASLDLHELLDASPYDGIEIEVHGNGEVYNLHLRTDDTRIVWQSYRASFHAPPCWLTVRLPFECFVPHRIDKPLDQRKLRRLGIVAIGRMMQADIGIAGVSLYRTVAP